VAYQVVRCEVQQLASPGGVQCLTSLLRLAWCEDQQLTSPGGVQ
jgi:hypothetical protein